jgi:trehalose utilization protein
MTRVTVWNEYRHEQEDERYRRVYPDGIHGAIAAGLREFPELNARLDTETNVAWVGYANPQLHQKIEPVLQELLREHQLNGPK